MKKIPVSTIFLLLAGTLVLPFLVLSFFARPSSDDLFLHYLEQQYGFVFVRHYLSEVISSRYFSLTLLLAFCSSRWVLSHYFLFPLFYMCAYFLASWRLVRTVNRRLMGNLLRGTWEPAVSLISLLLFLLVIPDTASGFYWISGSATHTTPAIALLLFASFFIDIMAGDRKWLFTAYAAVPVIIITGSSELLSLAMIWFLGMVALYQFRSSPPRLTPALFLFGLTIAGAAFLFLGSGNTARAGQFQTSGGLYAALGALYTYLGLWGRIFANPFFYACAFTVLFVLPSGMPLTIMGKKYWIVFWLTIPFVLYALPIYVNASGVPARASNPVALFLLLCLLGCLYQYRPARHIPVSRMMIWAACLMLLANTRFYRSWENLVSGYLYSEIYDQRASMINGAKNKGSHAITLPGYTAAWNEMVAEKIPASYRQPVIKLVSPVPELIHFSDDLYHKYWGESYAEYYGIDTIRCENVQHIRFALSDRGKAFAREMSTRKSQYSK